jgi:chromosome segregation ATPase
MAENYEVGKSYYLPVWVYEVMDDTYAYPVRFEFGKGNGCNTNAIENKPNLLLTAGEVVKENDLDTLLRDEVVTENNKLKARVASLQEENGNLTKACSEWQIAAQTSADNAKVADAAADNLRKENRELKAKVTELNVENGKLKDGADKLKDTLVDRTKDVQHLQEANNVLNSELDYRNDAFYAMKKERDTLLEENKKLKAERDQRDKDFWAMKKDRDELDSIGGKLREENEKLKAEVEDLTGQRDKYKGDAEYFHGEKLTAEENARSVRQENATLTGRNERLESENASLKAERDQRKNDLLAMKKDRDKLLAENEKLKQELKDAEASYNVVADTSLERKNRVVTMEEVIVALVEKIRRLESDD